ncbi:hypothetical protein FF38_05187 [Lucilia cuprina]|uniref:Uncharacterized protein n=1 Tax=Lucilia cuprina TaxID=7375 RepID=A0A0L0CG08_LUCCU|nr:hypothetical protein FF38_05187 [Lucilia cuprina]
MESGMSVQNSNPGNNDINDNNAHGISESGEYIMMEEKTHYCLLKD